MRVLVVTNLFPHPLDPNRSTFNRQQIVALAKQHEVRVICPVSWVDELRAKRKMAARIPSGRFGTLGKIPVDYPRYFYTPRILRGWYGRFYLRSVRKTFARAVREFRPDVVLGCWAYPDGWAAVKLGHEAGLPVVLKVH